MDAGTRIVHSAVLLTQERAGQRGKCVGRLYNDSFAHPPSRACCMRNPYPFIFAVLSLLAFSACEKDEGTPTSSGVDITFRTDSGYTYASDTVAQGDTLRIGAVITEGSDGLERLYFSVSYDDATAIGLDTVDVNANPFSYEALHITRTQPGSEQLIFTVEEPDGDRSTRRLTFVVQ